MKRRFAAVLAVFLVLVPVAVLSADDKEDAIKKEKAMLEDTVWQCVKTEGYPGGNQVLKTMTLKFGKNDTVNFSFVDRVVAGKYEIDPTQKPKYITVKATDKLNKGKTFNWVYALEGDNLVLCYNGPDGDRPPAIAAKAGGKDYYVFYFTKKAK